MLVLAGAIVESSLYLINAKIWPTRQPVDTSAGIPEAKQLIGGGSIALPISRQAALRSPEPTAPSRHGPSYQRAQDPAPPTSGQVPVLETPGPWSCPAESLF